MYGEGALGLEEVEGDLDVSFDTHSYLSGKKANKMNESSLEQAKEQPKIREHRPSSTRLSQDREMSLCSQLKNGIRVVNLAFVLSIEFPRHARTTVFFTLLVLQLYVSSIFADRLSPKDNLLVSPLILVAGPNADGVGRRSGGHLRERCDGSLLLLLRLGFQARSIASQDRYSAGVPLHPVSPPLTQTQVACEVRRELLLRVHPGLHLLPLGLPLLLPSQVLFSLTSENKGSRWLGSESSWLLSSPTPSSTSASVFSRGFFGSAGRAPSLAFSSTSVSPGSPALKSDPLNLIII